MEIFKIVGIGLLTCILAIIVRQIKPEFYIFVVIAGGLVMFLMVSMQLKSVISNFSNLIRKFNIESSNFILVLKIIGIAYLTEFASNICVDTNNNAIADKIIVAGKILILCLAFPIISNLLEIILNLLP